MIVVGLSPAAATGQLADPTNAGAAYAEVLSTYGEDPAAAVRGLLQWPRRDIQRGLVQFPRTPAGLTLRSGGDPAKRLLQQMALLHVEAAFAHYRRNDGDLMGFHLEWSRRIVRHELPWPTLDVLRTTPIDDAFRTEWALLVSGFFHLELGLAEGRRFLDEELQAAPGDPMLLLARGMTEEIDAGERAQPRTIAQVGANRFPATRTATVLTRRARAALEAAAALYRRALATEPALYEARIRLGRTLFHLGELGDAQRELEHALAQPLGDHEQYLATLFIAAVHEQHQQPARAERYLTRAVELFPAAQAPYLELSRLKALSDPDTAGEILLDMFGRSVAPSASAVADPWWVYDAGLGGSMQARLQRLRSEARPR
jgi:tetratricopeptide (TPR) repeat protein